MKLLILACACGAAVALSVPAAAQPAIAKHACVKPDDYPGRLASDGSRRNWQKSMDTYGDCVKKFTTEQRLLADTAMKSANDAIEEYNAVITKAKEAVEKANQ